MAGTAARRLWAGVRNALVWGAGWFGLAFLVMTAVRLAGGAPPTASWMNMLRTAARFGVMGVITGTAFSFFIGVRYRGRRLSEINWIRFGLGGGIVTGLVVPGFIIVARFLSGDPFLAPRHLLINGIVGLAFGGTAAAVTLKAAQIAERFLPRGRADQVDLLEGGDPPGGGDAGNGV